MSRGNRRETSGLLIAYIPLMISLPVLLIIQLQAEIEKLSKTAKHDIDFEKIKGGFKLN